MARPRKVEFSGGKGKHSHGKWWALVDDFRTLPLGQIVAGIPHIGELLLL